MVALRSSDQGGCANSCVHEIRAGVATLVWKGGLGISNSDTLLCRGGSSLDRCVIRGGVPTRDHGIRVGVPSPSYGAIHVVSIDAQRQRDRVVKVIDKTPIGICLYGFRIPTLSPRLSHTVSASAVPLPV